MNRDHCSVTFLPVPFTEGVEHDAAIHDLQRQASTGRQHPGGLPQDCFVLFLCVEESERVHHDDSAGAFGANWQPPHVTTDPMGRRAKFGRNLSRAVQKGGREVEADDVESTFRQGDRVSPMTTTDVDDAGCR